MFRNAPRASGYFRTGYAQDLALIQTRLEGAALAALALALALFPFFAGAFYLDLACQVFLAVIGALSLMLLTGYAGQISLGHAGLLAAGAFTVGILFREVRAPFWLTLPAAALVGAVLGVIFGLPSLRLRGLYLAVSTLALYFVVAYLGGEYESRRGFSTGIMIDAPSIGGFALKNARGWYFVLLAAAAATLLICANLLRSRTGRAWRAIRAHETVAEALGIGIASYKLLAFVISSAHGVARGSAVRLLSRLRFGRGVFPVPVDPVRRHDHHRRHGLAARRAARRLVRDAVAIPDRGAAHAIAGRAELCRVAVRDELFRLRRRS